MNKIYQNPGLVVIISFFIIAIGLKNFFDLPIALYPNTTQPIVTLNLWDNNTNPEDFKEKYGSKIESALSAIEGVELVEGQYHQNSSFWTVKYGWGVDEKRAKIDVQAAVAPIEATFPESWYKLHINYKTSNSAQMYVSVYSDQYSEQELKTILEGKLLSGLESIKGIAQPGIFIPAQEYVRVELKPALMAALGVSPKLVKEALSKKKYDKGLGALVTEKNSYDIIVLSKDHTLQDVRNTIITKKKDVVLRLEDFADVSIATQTQKRLMKANGKNSLIAYASVKPDGNISFVCKEFIDRIATGIKEIDPEIKMIVLTNPSRFIEDAIANIIIAIFLGISIATLIIFLFLGSFSSTFMIALSIPLSLFGGLILMSLFGIELNLISLGAMALSVGMVVDGAIVVLENVARHFEIRKPVTYAQKVEATVLGIKEVKGAVIASLLTTIIVFAPLAFTAPLANAILGDLAKVIVCVLVISVGVTLYLIPPLLILLRGSKSGFRKRGVYYFSFRFSQLVDYLQKLYVRILGNLMHRPKSRVLFFSLISLVLLASLAVLTSHVKREIIAEPDSDKVWINMSWQDRGGTLEISDERTQVIERIIEDEFGKYVRHYFTNVFKRNSNLLLTLRDKKLLHEFKEKIEKRFVNSPDVHYWVNTWNPTSLEIPQPALLDITVTGKDGNEKRAFLKALSESAYELEDIGWVNAKPGFHKHRYYDLILDKEKILRVRDLDPNFAGTINETVQSYLGDVYIKKMNIGSEEYRVVMRYPEKIIKGPDDLKNIIFKLGESYYPLRNFAHPELKETWSGYYSENSREKFFIKIFPKTSFKGDKEELKEKLLNKIKEKTEIDYSALTFSDTEKEINESLYSLLYALAFAIVLILIVLSFQFGTIKQPLIIMMAIPLGLIGVSFSLYAFSSTLSVNSMLGMILLSGTAVNNSIIFVDFFNTVYKRTSKEQLVESLLETAKLRLRPILITTATTILGMMPIAFAFGSGGEVLQPLGIAVCGGLGISTLLTLFVIPLVLYMVEVRVWKTK